MNEPVDLAARPAPETSTPTAVREPRSRRHFLRTRAPLRAEIEGDRYEVADWSLGGFALVAGEGRWKRGDRLEARLAVPMHGFECAFTATCEVVHVGRAGRFGLRFCDIEAGQTEMLRQVMNFYADGRLPSLDALALPTALHQSVPGPPDAPPPRLPGRRLRYAALLLAGLAVAGVAALSLYQTLFVVRSHHGAVTAPLFRVKAPADGALLGDGLPAGSEVTAGQPVVVVADDDLAAAIELAEAELNREVARVEALRERLAKATSFFADYVRLARAALSRAEAEVAQARAGLALAERDAGRIAELHATGHAPDARLDQALQKRLQSEQALRLAQARRDEARANLRMAEAGRYFSGGRVEGGEPERLAEELRLAEASVEVHSRRLAALIDRRLSLEVASPCDCVVHAEVARPGERVEKGDTVLLLREPGDALWITAKVAQDDVAAIAEGGVAVISGPGGRAVVYGRILSISRAIPAEARAGLPDKIERDPGFATVAVEVDDMPADWVVGTPLEVAFPTAPGRWLARVFGG